MLLDPTSLAMPQGPHWCSVSAASHISGTEGEGQVRAVHFAMGQTVTHLCLNCTHGEQVCGSARGLPGRIVGLWSHLDLAPSLAQPGRQLNLQSAVIDRTDGCAPFTPAGPFPAPSMGGTLARCNCAR